MDRPSLLLHSCCGPCSSAVLERLTEHFRVTVLYYNPNIEPEAEYLHRLSEQQRLLSLLPDDIPLLPCDYGHEAFAAFAPALAEAPEGGERCLACFALRLGYTAEQAKLRGFEYFTTTLSVSPHKNADNVNRIGAEAGERFGVRYLHADFKKKNGYLRSLHSAVEGIRPLPAGLLRLPVFPGEMIRNRVFIAKGCVVMIELYVFFFIYMF